MKVKQIIKGITFYEIFKGLALTLSNLPPWKAVTRQYPEEPWPASPGFRGLHALVRDKKTGREKCIACGLCAAICPSQCIHIHSSEDDEGNKVAEEYEIEVLRCVFCGFCVEACPVGAVVLTPHYEYSDYSREAFLYDKERLLENWDKYLPGKKGDWYIKNFWRHPNEDDFRAHDDQPVFKGRATGENS
jgi:NADH-quinone oxidoreductase subunit I